MLLAAMVIAYHQPDSRPEAGITRGLCKYCVWGAGRANGAFRPGDAALARLNAGA
jgi:hypothetical protein